MAEPRYQDLRASAMPVREEDGVTVRVFSGASGGVQAATLNHVPVTFVEIAAEAGAAIVQDLPASYNGFIYVLEGSGTFGADETKGTKGEVLWLHPAAEAGDSEVRIAAGPEGPLRAIVVAGQPLGEPVVAQGPF